MDSERSSQPAKTRIFLLAVAIVSQAVGISAVANYGILTFAIFQMCGVACSCVAASWPAPLTRTALPRHLLVAGLCGFVPLIGVIGLFTLTLPTWQRSRERLQSGLLEFSLMRGSLSALNFDADEQDSDSKLVTSFSRVDQIRTLGRTRYLSAKTALPILREGLTDPSDEVRLIARSMITRLEQGFEQRAQALTNRLAKACPIEAARLHRALAEASWELIRSGIVTDEARLSALRDAQRHAARSLDIDPQVGTRLLLGRILLEQHELDSARRELVQVVDQGIPQNVVDPFLAEALFIERRFDDLRHYLRHVQASPFPEPMLRSVSNLWLA